MRRHVQLNLRGVGLHSRFAHHKSLQLCQVSSARVSRRLSSPPCYLVSPPWIVWSAERGGGPCLRAAACPATPGRGRLPAPSPALQTVSPRGGASGEGRGRLHTGGTSGKGAGKEVSQSHLEDGVQLVEALQAPHSLASAAGEGVVSG